MNRTRTIYTTVWLSTLGFTFMIVTAVQAHTSATAAFGWAVLSAVTFAVNVLVFCWYLWTGERT